MILSDTFSDITPIPQDDGPDAVCAIEYPREFDEAQGYLRALMKMDERSGKILNQSLQILQSIAV